MTGRAAPRWVFADDLAHVLADRDGADGGVPEHFTVCGLGLAATATVYTVPPSLDMCWACVPLPGDAGSSPPGSLDVPPPEFGTPTVF
jgi:hypothetical protein